VYIQSCEQEFYNYPPDYVRNYVPQKPLKGHFQKAQRACPARCARSLARPAFFGVDSPKVERAFEPIPPRVP
jgi:hypothetical protein